MSPFLKLFYMFLGIALVVPFFLDISQGQTVKGSGDDIVVTEKDNNSLIELNKGGVLLVQLEHNPGTGYSWQVARNNGKLLELAGETSAPAAGGKVTMGGSEVETFRFQAVNKGTDIIELQCKRAWEKEKEPLKNFLITVKIH